MVSRLTKTNFVIDLVLLNCRQLEYLFWAILIPNKTNGFIFFLLDYGSPTFDPACSLPQQHFFVLIFRPIM